MAVHLWTIVSQRALIDGQTNNATIVDVLEQITIPPLPSKLEQKKVLIPIPVSVMTLWRRENPDRPESFKVRLVIRAPSGKKLLTSGSVVDMRRHLRYRVTTRLNGLPFHGAGTYRFDVETLKGRKWRRADRQFVELFVSNTPVKVPPIPKPQRMVATKVH